MGTHPIFESDFDCLTEKSNLCIMSMNGNWKKVKSDNAAAFGTAIGATKEQMEKAAKTVTTLTYKVTGNTITTSRTCTGPDGAKTVTNTGTIGAEATTNSSNTKSLAKLLVKTAILSSRPS